MLLLASEAKLPVASCRHCAGPCTTSGTTRQVTGGAKHIY